MSKKPDFEGTLFVCLVVVICVLFFLTLPSAQAVGYKSLMPEEFKQPDKWADATGEYQIKIIHLTGIELQETCKNYAAAGCWFVEDGIHYVIVQPGDICALLHEIAHVYYGRWHGPVADGTCGPLMDKLKDTPK